MTNFYIALTGWLVGFLLALAIHHAPRPVRKILAAVPLVVCAGLFTLGWLADEAGSRLHAWAWGE